MLVMADHITITTPNPPPVLTLRFQHQVRFQIPRSTKLYTCLSFFLLFTQFTFAAEAKVHPEFANRILDSQGNHRGESSRRRESNNEQESEDIDVVFEEGQGSASVNHEQAIAHGIAQEIFFYPTEANFYESKWSSFVEEWSQESLGRYHDALTRNSNLSQIEFFAMDTLGWDNMTCSYHDLNGCTNMPSPEYVRSRYPTQRHRARQIIYTLEGIRKLHVETAIYTRTLEIAKKRLEGFCEEFSEIFFHEPTKHKAKMCTAAIVNIVMAIITAILTIITLGEALIFMAPALAYAWTLYTLEMTTMGGIQAAIRGTLEVVKGVVMAQIVQTQDYLAQVITKSLLELGRIRTVIPEVLKNTGKSIAQTLTNFKHAAQQTVMHMSRGGPLKDIARVWRNGYNWDGVLSEITRRYPYDSTIWRPPSPRSFMSYEASSILVGEENLGGKLQILEDMLRKLGIGGRARMKGPLTPKTPDTGYFRDFYPWEQIGIERPAKYAKLPERSSPSQNNVTVVWGAFGIFEHFTTEELAKASPGNGSLYGQMNISSTPYFIGTGSSPKPRQEARDHASNSTEGKMVNRNSLLFALKAEIVSEDNDTANARPATVPITSPELNTASIWNLKGRLLPHFSSHDGQPLGIQTILTILHDKESEIHDQLRNLKLPDGEHRATEIRPRRRAMPRSLDYEFVVPMDYMPWRSILGGLTFKGATAHGDGTSKGMSPKLEWHVTPPLMHDTSEPSGKRSMKRSVEVVPNYHVAATHDIIGFGKTLQSLDLAIPHQTWKRSASGQPQWNVDNDGSDDVFSVHMDGEHFTNKIKTHECGNANYEDNGLANELACQNFLDDAVQKLTDKIVASLERLNAPLDFFDSKDPGWKSPLVTTLQQRFSTYSNFVALREAEVTPGGAKELEHRLFHKMKNNLVNKAYADQQCYVKCTSTINSQGKLDPVGGIHRFNDTDCRPGCYDPTQQKHERLYGLDPDKNMKGAQEPWVLNEGLITNVSWQAYQSHSRIGYLPGAFNMDPYEQNVRDETPVLPVCRSDYIRLERSHHAETGNWPCTCGNKYGNESVMFWESSNWVSRATDFEDDIIEDCREGPLSELKKTNPAAYMINLCNVVYKGVIPPGTGSIQDQKDKGSYHENLRACKMYWKYYEDNKNMTDADLDSNMCKLWSKFSKNWDRGGDGKDDFSYINDDLEDWGCKPYKKFWKKTCKKGRQCCDMPPGYREPTTNKKDIPACNSNDVDPFFY